MAGIFAFRVTVEVGYASGMDFKEDPLVTTEFGGFLVTTLVGGPLALCALGSGYVVMAIGSVMRRGRATGDATPR